MRESVFENIAETTQENKENDKDILQIHVITAPYALLKNHLMLNNVSLTKKVLSNKFI